MAYFLGYSTDNGDAPLTATTVLYLGGDWQPPIDFTEPNAGPTSPSPAQDPHPVWTGTGLTGTCSKIAVSAFSDAAGSLAVQQSFDGVNWDIGKNGSTTTVLTVLASATNDGLLLDVTAPYMRLVYTNGSDDNTILRIYARVYGNGRNNG
jgi:hypothetical protein